MDAVCDTLLLEEILPRLAPKNLLRLVPLQRPRPQPRLPRPVLVARWRLLGPCPRHKRQRVSSALPHRPLFKPCVGAQARRHEPRLVSQFQRAYYRGGLPLLMAHSTRVLPRRPTSQSAHYYVCNPVTWQRAVLPELRSLCFDPQCVLLTVAGTRSQFQVVVIEQWQMEDMDLRLKVFSSGTSQWESRRISLFESSLPFEHDFRPRPVLGQSGAAYCLQPRDDMAIAYHSDGDSFQVIALPRHLASRKRDRVIGERHGGGGLRFTEAHASVLEVWEWVCDSQSS
ncbi:unnamed protein product [Miscanthus lutarioriparius]|uniref:F-box protein At3g26010-like beta-propeller domain-containing protein n=1 Tax=Miscanthus lutarioriparius TaxID=422564 RepID=A0A811P087_9POAL|nr:unnamed protein product [Miscanthus lutarioriparius]